MPDMDVRFTSSPYSDTFPPASSPPTLPHSSLLPAYLPPLPAPSHSPLCPENSQSILFSQRNFPRWLRCGFANLQRTAPLRWAGESFLPHPIFWRRLWRLGRSGNSDAAENTSRVYVPGRRGCAGWGLRGGGGGVEGVRVKLCPTARLFPTRTHAVSVSTYSIIKLGQ